jgi:hypothetical protein
MKMLFIRNFSQKGTKFIDFKFITVTIKILQDKINYTLS